VASQVIEIALHSSFVKIVFSFLASGGLKANIIGILTLSESYPTLAGPQMTVRSTLCGSEKLIFKSKLSLSRSQVRSCQAVPLIHHPGRFAIDYPHQHQRNKRENCFVDSFGYHFLFLEWMSVAIVCYNLYVIDNSDSPLLKFQIFSLTSYNGFYPMSLCCNIDSGK